MAVDHDKLRRDAKAAKQRQALRDTAKDRGWFDDLARTKEGKLVACAANAISILKHDERWAGVLAYNEFTSAIVALKPPPWCEDDRPAPPPENAGGAPAGAAPVAPAAADWQDTDTIRAQAWLMRIHGLQLGREQTWDAIAVTAEHRRFHPVREYLDGLKWDGVKRLPTFFSAYLGAEQNDYTTLVSQSFLVSAVARIYRPGDKVDTMPVLEGPQGIRKSSALRVLFGGPAGRASASSSWFSDTPIDLYSKDRFTDLRGKWCLEFAELDSLGRADANRCKSYITSACDTFRPPYGRTTVTVPRQCVFAGTTNASAYLQDTENRRYYPARCGAVKPIDLAGIARDRDLLWAEARLTFEDGFEWWPPAPLAAVVAEEQAGRVIQDAWLPLVETFLGRPRVLQELTVGDVLTEAIGLSKDRWGQPEQNRVARCMRLAGWERVRRRRHAGRPEWLYVPPTPAEQPASTTPPPAHTSETHDASSPPP